MNHSRPRVGIALAAVALVAGGAFVAMRLGWVDAPGGVGGVPLRAESSAGPLRLVVTSPTDTVEPGDVLEASIMVQNLSDADVWIEKSCTSHLSFSVDAAAGISDRDRELFSVVDGRASRPLLDDPEGCVPRCMMPGTMVLVPQETFTQTGRVRVPNVSRVEGASRVGVLTGWVSLIVDTAGAEPDPTVTVTADISLEG